MPRTTMIALVALCLAAVGALLGGCVAASTTPNSGAGGQGAVSQPATGSQGAGGSSVATSEGGASAQPTATPVKPMRAGTVAPPAQGAYLGVFTPPAPFQPKAIDVYSAAGGRKPAIVMWYQQWGAKSSNGFDTAMVASVYRRGAVPMISWEPWDPGSKPHNLQNPADAPEWNLASIASGKHDAYISTWARAIKRMGGPIMLRPMHEMNGNWYPWSGTANGNTPEQYVAAWRHIHEVFAREGVSNVTWVWSVNSVDKPVTAGNVPSTYYPGDEYVDWVSVSGFNWGSTVNVPWRSLDQIVGGQLVYLRTLGKPVLIGETASVEQGGSKSAWLAQTYATLPTTHPEIRAVVYYDAYEKGVKHGVQDWRISSSAKSAKAFRKATASPYFVGAPVPEVTSWLAGLSANARARLGLPLGSR